MKKVLALVMVCLMMVALVACSAETYKLTSVSAYGVSYTLDEFKEMSGTDISDSTVSLRSNGTYTAKLMGENYAGKWEQNGIDIVLDKGTSDEMSGTLEGNTLTLSITGVSLIFEK